MADEGFLGGLLGGIGNAAQGVGSGLAGLLGGGQTGGPSSSGYTPDEERRMMISTLGQLGSTLLAAGQKQSPAQRAQYLAQLGGIGSGAQNDIYKARQGALMSAQMQEKMREMEQRKSLEQWMTDPENLKKIGVTPEQARVLGPSGISSLLQASAVKQMSVTPAQAAADRAIANITAGALAPPSQQPAPAPQPSAAVTGEAPQPAAGGVPVTATPSPVQEQMSGEDIARAIASNPAIVLGRPNIAKDLAGIADSLGKESREVRTAMQKEYLKPIFERASSINSLMPALDAAEKASAGVPGGPAAQVLNYYGRIASTLGLPVPEGSAQASLLSSIGTQLAPIFKLPGAVSNAEMELYMRAGPSLGDTPEANKLKIDLMRALGTRAKQIADVGYRYAGRNEVFQKISELDQPVFTEAQRKRLEEAAGISTQPAQQPAAAPAGRARVLRVIE